MKLFSQRATDYFRSASVDDRRYLLYNPMVKMKVPTQGEEVINLLWDVIAARGFEKDVYFEMAARDIRSLPKLEGTVHVNMALIIKFMANFFFNPAEFPEIPRRVDAADDEFLFNQGPTRGLGKIRFHDYRIAYDSVDLPNVNLFKDQIQAFTDFLAQAAPSKEQAANIDFLLTIGELFTLVAYGQLIIERYNLEPFDSDLLEQIFDFMIRDFSRHALEVYYKRDSSEKQQEMCLAMIRKPPADYERFERFLKNHVYALRDAYEMNP
jgi:acyl-CoA dehydrogenase